MLGEEGVDLVAPVYSWHRSENIHRQLVSLLEGK